MRNPLDSIRLSIYYPRTTTSPNKKNKNPKQKQIPLSPTEQTNKARKESYRKPRRHGKQDPPLDSTAHESNPTQPNSTQRGNRVDPTLPNHRRRRTSHRRGGEIQTPREHTRAGGRELTSADAGVGGPPEPHLLDDEARPDEGARRHREDQPLGVVGGHPREPRRRSRRRRRRHRCRSHRRNLHFAPATARLLLQRRRRRRRGGHGGGGIGSGRER